MSDPTAQNREPKNAAGQDRLERPVTDPDMDALIALTKVFSQYRSLPQYTDAALAAISLDALGWPRADGTLVADKPFADLLARIRAERGMVQVIERIADSPARGDFRPPLEDDVQK